MVSTGGLSHAQVSWTGVQIPTPPFNKTMANPVHTLLALLEGDVDLVKEHLVDSILDDYVFPDMVVAEVEFEEVGEGFLITAEVYNQCNEKTILRIRDSGYSTEDFYPLNY